MAQDNLMLGITNLLIAKSFLRLNYISKKLPAAFSNKCENLDWRSSIMSLLWNYIIVCREKNSLYIVSVTKNIGTCWSVRESTISMCIHIINEAT